MSLMSADVKLPLLDIHSVSKCPTIFFKVPGCIEIPCKLPEILVCLPSAVLCCYFT